VLRIEQLVHRLLAGPAPIGRVAGRMSRWESGTAQVDSPTVG
jgi:hypothetical protein